MTVQSSSNKTIALGNGAATTFDFNFVGVAAAYISVIYTDANGNETTLSQGSGATQYQISLNSASVGALWGVGGTITYNPNGMPIAAGTTLTILRTLPLTQAVSLQFLGSLATLGNGAETGLDTIEMQLQQVVENIDRAIVAPSVDPSTISLVLPPAAQRSNTGLAFDAQGNVIAGTIPATGLISTAMQGVVNAATLAAGLNTLAGASNSTAEIGTITTETHSVARTVASKLNDVLTPLDFGCVGDGATDDTTNFQNAVSNTPAGGTLDLAGRTYKITTTITGISNIVLANGTLKQGAYPGAHPILDFTNCQNWAWRNITFEGDNQGAAYNQPGSVGLKIGNMGPTTLSDMEISGCTFTGFGDSYWLYGNISSTAGVTNLRIFNNTFTDNGGAYIVSAHYGIALFSSTDGGPPFDGTMVHDNYINGAYLTIAIAFFGNHQNYFCGGNVIENVGTNSTFNPTVGDQNCYGIIAYNQGATNKAQSSQFRFANNIIANPPSAGIYLAGSTDGIVDHNVVSGQFRTDNATLPRGGISMNSATVAANLVCEGNYLFDCWCGIGVACPSTGGTLRIRDNFVRYAGTATDATGVRLTGSATTTDAPIMIEDNRLDLAGSASVAILVGTAGSFGSFEIARNRIRGANQGISASSIACSGKTQLSYNSYAGSFAGIVAELESITSHLVIRGETFDLNGATGVGLDVTNSTAVTMADIVFMNRTSGNACYTASGTEGTLDGFRYVIVSPALQITAGHLGYSIPTFAGNASDVVQDLGSQAYQPQGTAGSQYLIPRWRCQSSSTWYPERVLSGT